MSHSTTTVEVALSERSYPIVIGRGTLAGVAELVAREGRPGLCAVVSDSEVAPRYGEPVVQALRGAGHRAELLVVPAGEKSKSIEQATSLWDQLLALGADRHAAVVAVGGGVVGDLAGFVAATFARGLPFFQVPTSLLAQVDSSVGGKTGVNLPRAKNMVGCIYQPRGVLIDTDVLATLPAREYRAGLAEVVKYGVILDADFFAYLEAHIAELNRRDPPVLTHVIARCCRLKGDVVERDERETTGLRAVLNYGHTFGHALEAVAGYGELSHGEAVAIGMIFASRLAERLGRIDATITQRQLALLEALGLPVRLPETANANELLSAMRHDKKSAAGQLRFILPTRLGHVELAPVPDANVRAVLAN